MKLIITSLAAGLLLGATGVSAQTLQIGPNGPSIDFRSEEQRDRDEWRERRRMERRAYRAYDTETTGSVRRGDCETVVIRERDRFGDMETRRIRRCR